MINKLLRFSVLLLFVSISCSKEENNTNDVINIDSSQKEPLTAKQVNQNIDESINTKGSFNWKNASNHLLWSASYQGNNLISLGFGNSKEDFERAKSPNNANIQNELLQIILKYEKKPLNKILVSSDKYLN